MTAQEALKKIQQLFADAPAPNNEGVAPAPTEAPKEYTLADGSKIMVDVYEIGGSVSIIDTGGNSVAAPMGEYVLADGAIVTVDENSKIVSITTPEGEQPIASTNEKPQEQQVNPFAEQIAKLESEINALKSLIGVNQSNFAEQQKQLIGIKEVLVALVNIPSSDPIETSPNNFRHVESKNDKIAKYLEFVKTIKKN